MQLPDLINKDVELARVGSYIKSFYPKSRADNKMSMMLANLTKLPEV